MTFSLAELRSVSNEELIRRHDYIAETTGSSVNYYLEELGRRDQQKATEAMERYTRNTRDYTRWITWMTCVVTLTTLLNLVVALLMLRRG
jgi:hypothetical protein